MPFGLLAFVCFIGLCLLPQLIPVPRSPLLKYFSFWTSLVVNEQPHWWALFLALSAAFSLLAGDVGSIWGWLVVALALAEVAGLSYLLKRALPGRAVLREALISLSPGADERLGKEPSRTGTLLAPFGFGRRGVERIGDIVYGPAGRTNLLDLYRPRNGPATGPTLIYLHGGGFTSGDKRREGQLAMYRLASRGWTCVSANYRLTPEVQLPEYVIDLKRVIAWVRTEGVELGADPSRIFLAGGSAGGHIVSTAALCESPDLQPGFEHADTSVDGVIGLYGYYGSLEYGRMRPGKQFPSSPRQLVRAGAPPFLLVHGDRDTVVPLANARSFATELAHSNVPVALAELPGAQHTFDLLRSVRNEDAIDAIEDFANWVESRD